jgi:LysM repeat protein
MFVKLMIVCLLAAAGVGAIARPSESAGPPRYYTVQPGDTLWSIAQQHGSGDPREAVWELRQRNDVEAGSLQPGDVLVLP